jgi:cytochrome b6-f complex iron-sulfur subunit
VTRVLALSSGTVAAILVVAAIDVFALIFGLSFVRARRAERAATAAGTAGAPSAIEGARPSSRPISRRDFFRSSLVWSLVVFGAQFGVASIAFLWPNLKGGFGSLISAGKLDDIKSEIQDNKGGPVYFGQGRFYIVPWSGHPSGDVNYEAEGVTAQGIMPLYQRCVHLGCRVPFCDQSQWFECPCHGSKYNKAGEYQLGPAPRGLDRFLVNIDSAGNVSVDTSQIILGPPRGTNTIDEPPQGPFCVAPA